MSETFAQYIEKWQKQSTVQGLTNPLVKMPIKRFRPLQPAEFESIANGGTFIMGTTSDPVARNLYKNYQMRIRERGERCAFVCFGSVELVIGGAVDQQLRTSLFPVYLKRATLDMGADKIRVTVSDEDMWQMNPVLQSHLRSLGIDAADKSPEKPDEAVGWLGAQLGNRARSVKSDSYVGLFSSQQMVLQQRLAEPSLRQALARNPLIQSKIAGTRVAATEPKHITDDGLEELGLVLPCDDDQLRVIQLSNQGYSLQVEGPPGTGKSQTIANIISNALFHGRRVLLVCDKRAAIVQVEERLSNCGLKPALLNLHDEDLDKREFLRQAVDRFPASGGMSARSAPPSYPMEQLRQTRQTLNDRVRFGTAVAHPSLQVTNRDALGGMIRLRADLKGIPNIAIPNWQSLSRDRLATLLDSIAEWPELDSVISNTTNIWNLARPAAFDSNPNIEQELPRLLQTITESIASLDKLTEDIASVGIELRPHSDDEVNDLLEMVTAVLDKPNCYSRIVGNSQVTIKEINWLESQWNKRQGLIDAGHPVDLSTLYGADAEKEAKQILADEAIESWEELSRRVTEHQNKHDTIKRSQDTYLRFCNQIGIIYSPLLKVRRAQYQAILDIGRLAAPIPHLWWNANLHPVLMIEGWIGKFRMCAGHQQSSPFPLQFLSLERIAETHWNHVEAMAEHGFNALTYVKKCVDDRKCKYALKQAYPAIPLRGFKGWRELTLHAVAARGALTALRKSADAHAILVQLTETYLSIAHHADCSLPQFLEHQDLKRLSQTAALVQQWRERNDLFDVGSTHWQTFWESANPRMVEQVRVALSELDELILPDQRSDNVEDALAWLDHAVKRIKQFLILYERPGDRAQAVLKSLDAQKEFAECQRNLEALPKYLEAHSHPSPEPEWDQLTNELRWRDKFVALRGTQRFDMDSPLWEKIQHELILHQRAMTDAGSALSTLFEGYTEEVGRAESRLVRFNASHTYKTLVQRLDEIATELQASRHPLWLEKRRWALKLGAFPELQKLWGRAARGEVDPANARALFCFNLLRLCEPVARPSGPMLRQTLSSFASQDKNLASWILEGLKAKQRDSMAEAAKTFAASESELRRLSGLQRIRGTIRELVNTHVKYLLAAKSCWMMSPTSLANLLSGDNDSLTAKDILSRQDAPFNVVIFDEASQIRVLDGLLSMAFGQQVIIVGDKHQLPPTDFFTSFAEPDQDVDPLDFGTSESLLNEFEGVFEEDKTHVMLMSHYRSETPDLIRFSNDWFYSKEPGTPGSGRLQMYPPARIAGIGRRLHYVPNATYSETAGQRNNPAEAREVVKLIELHVKESPEKSLGIVTMNIPQMELIEEQIQYAPKTVQDFCAAEQKFFLRNLETVQGDEMDRIIISLTYGKNASGQFNAAVLGPLTKGGGERRLNVAITRSRNGTTVVSSLKAADLATSGAQSIGFRCLRALLIDLESAERSRNFGITSERFKPRIDGVANLVYCESPFEEQVVEFLENQGYELECQYGDGRFRLDIVVKEKGKNLLAIECDGASYHSSLVARTRDRAREETLRSRGWTVHHVWSTNWWLFEQQEKQAIIDAINSARSGQKR